MPWLEQYYPKLSFCIINLIFNFDHCTTSCLSQGKASTAHNYYSLEERGYADSDKFQHNKPLLQGNICYNIAEISTYAFMTVVQKEDHQAVAF